LETAAFFWRFSLTKPLVLPGVDKKALANELNDLIDLKESVQFFTGQIAL
jgi:hypothetical protein